MKFRAYIIDSYNKYDSCDREHQRKTFEINEQWYAIYEVEVEWGLPVLPLRTMYDQDTKQYFIYDTKEEAMRFVQLMKGLN